MKYDYHCPCCELRHEVEHPMAQDALKVCPRCDSDTYHKVISANPFILKGEGWESHETSGRYHPVDGT